MTLKFFMFVTLVLVHGWEIPGVKANNPVLNITEINLREMQSKIRHYPLAAARWQNLLAVAGDALEEEVVLPPRGGNWHHYYVDPDEGQPLIPGKYLGDWRWEHHNQAGTKTYAGDPSTPVSDYDGVLILNQVHYGWTNKLFALSLGYRITGEDRYLAKAAEILSAYADKYLTYAIHDNAGGSDPGRGTGAGRIAAQGLDESVWFTRVLQSLGLIWGDLDVELRQTLETRLLRPGADLIARCRPLGVHNIQCWYNAAVGMTGYLLGDGKLQHWALYADGQGLQAQLEHGFTDDGHWYERAPSYHFYALQPLILLAETAANNGVPDFLPRLKRAFDAPFQLMMPDFHLPRFNDCRSTYLPAHGDYYEYAYARFSDPAYLPVIYRSREMAAGALAAGRSPNVFDQALLYGPSDPECGTAPVWTSRHLPETGYDVLVSGDVSAPDIWTAVKYDTQPAMGGHAHPDVLSFVWYAAGRMISADPGIAEYGAPVHGGWYKTTLAHNTLVVDERSQPIRGARSLAFGEAAGIKYSVVGADGIYDGIGYRRAVIVPDRSTVLVVDAVQAASPAQLDIAYHQRGAWGTRPAGTPFDPPDKPSYRYLIEPSAGRQGREHRASTILGGDEIHVLLQSPDPFSLITATGLGPDFERVPVLIARKMATEMVVVWQMRIGDHSLPMKTTVRRGGANPRVDVRLGDRTLMLDLWAERRKDHAGEEPAYFRIK
jgi:oligo-alginate lyase